MKIVFLQEQTDGNGLIFAEFQKVLNREQSHKLMFIFYDSITEKNICAKIKETAPDLIITTNLLGFEQKTLTDNLAFNLLDCKQIHLLLHENLINEVYLSKQLSISMFFYCLGEDYFRNIAKKYPNLPYLKKIDGWQIGESPNAVKTNAKILFGIVQEVLEQCGLSQ